jgi:hypothetical protein
VVVGIWYERAADICGYCMCSIDNQLVEQRRISAMNKLVEFTISVEVEGDDIKSPSSEERDLFDRMMSDMEEVVGRSPCTLNDAYWEVL